MIKDLGTTVVRVCPAARPPTCWPESIECLRGDWGRWVWVVEGMPPEPGEWIIPVPLRTLLWWPFIAFIVAILLPSSAAAVIAATGAGLAMLGVLGAAVRSAMSGRVNSRRPPLAR